MKELVFVDDDMRRMQYYAEYLELEGFHVVYFQTDKEAFDFISGNTHRIDLLIIDMIMPSILFGREETDNYWETGLRLLQEIRLVAPKLPVIVFSVRRDIDSLSKLRTLRVAKTMIKDQTTAAQLAAQVNNILNHPPK